MLRMTKENYDLLSPEEVRRQIGMAVPVDGAQIIFEAVLKTFAGVEYEHVDCNIPFNNGQ